MIIYPIIAVVVAVAIAAGTYSFRRRRTHLAQEVPPEGALPVADEADSSPAPVRVPPPPVDELSTLTEDDKKQLLNAIWYRCENPHCNHGSFLNVHHIVSEVEGGNGLNNLIVLCSVCHAAAHNNEIPAELLQTWVQNRPDRFRYKLDWRYK